MGWNELVCARCRHLVSEGNCSTCRAARDEMWRFRLPELTRAMLLQLVLALALLIAAVTVAVERAG